MVERFQNDEAGYLRWLEANPHGYVVNVDEPNHIAQYPMVHRATHKVLSSPHRTNYTTGRYIKICSDNLQELEGWSKQKYGRQLVRCAQCTLP
jgi:hypothetical protein